MTEKIPASTMFPEKAIDTAATVNANVYVPSMPATEISAKCIVGNLTIQPEITSARISTVAEKASAAARGTIPPRYFARKIFLRLRPSEKMTLTCFLLCTNLNKTVPEMIPKITMIGTARSIPSRMESQKCPYRFWFQS